MDLEMKVRSRTYDMTDERQGLGCPHKLVRIATALVRHVSPRSKCIVGES